MTTFSDNELIDFLAGKTSPERSKAIAECARRMRNSVPNLALWPARRPRNPVTQTRRPTLASQANVAESCRHHCRRHHAYRRRSVGSMVRPHATFAHGGQLQ